MSLMLWSFGPPRTLSPLSPPADHIPSLVMQVLVEYAPAEVDTFIAFADAVEEEFEGIMVDGVEVRQGPCLLGSRRQRFRAAPTSLLPPHHHPAAARGGRAGSYLRRSERFAAEGGKAAC